MADAIFDCSDRGAIVLDPFAGSGTTIIAAERTGRRCYAMELDPRYVDVSLRRYRQTFDVDPVHQETGLTLSELEQQRQAAAAAA